MSSKANTVYRKVRKWAALASAVPLVLSAFSAPVSAADPTLVPTPLSASLSKEQLVAQFLGGAVTVSNIQYVGSDEQAGTFSGGADIIGIDKGIMLTTGSVYNVVGPNTSQSKGSNSGTPGDDDLNALIPGYGTTNRNVLEFDFVPAGDILKFTYVFASDEYNEYVGSSYNDVFGFFLNGTNIALLPDGTPVAINNVNKNQNSEYYVDNEFYGSDVKFNTEMDGFTKVLSVEAHVNKNQTNHIKLAIADAGDTAYDSAIFFGAQTFTSEPVGNLQFSQPSYTVGEDGPEAVITVTRSNGTSGTVSVDYATSDGSASAGQDYTAASGMLTFAAGETTKTFAVPILEDTADESDETVNLTLSNPTGGAALGERSTAQLVITDNDDTEAPPLPTVISFASNAAAADEGQGTVTLNVERTGGTDGTSTVAYCFCNKTAKNGEDYHGTNGTLTFAPGETVKTITVDIIDDTKAESAETFGVFLKNPTGAVLGAIQQSWVTIADDDPAED